MALTIVQIVAGLALLAMGAEGLVRGAASLALRLGVPSIVVGLTIVAFGTSSPELIVSIKAAMAGNGGIAIGNVVGSNIFNIGAILGISALVFPITLNAAFVRREAPIMIGVAFLVFVLAWFGGHVVEPDGTEHWTIARWGGWVCVALGLAYTYYAYRLARREGPDVVAQFEAGAVGGESSDVGRTRPFWIDAAMLITGLVVLVIGSRLLVDGSVTLARALGVSDLVIGLTIISAGTSLPELATSLVAALRKQTDICVGNVIGSNIYNVLLVLGAAGVAAPIWAAPELITRDIPAMLIMSFACLFIMMTGKRVTRLEGGLLVGGFLAYMALLLVQSAGRG